jgi:hypothetical protein
MDMSLSLVYSFMFWIEFLLFFIMEHWKFGMVDVEYLPQSNQASPSLALSCRQYSLRFKINIIR